ncbi:MAG: MFS transporter [Acidimicrobiales bacterium]
MTGDETARDRTLAAGYEDVEDALVEGDRPVRPGTARAALRHRPFTILWSGTMASNVGTWMQNVALGALAFQLTHSTTFVALIGFAQLAPILLLAVIGGALADACDRRMLLVITNAEQLLFSLVLAWVAFAHNPGHLPLFLAVLAVGIGNALSGPPLSALLPTLVDRDEIPGAVSLFSTQMNLSRVIGPAIGGVILPLVHPWGIFAINAGTYLFAVVAALAVPRMAPAPSTGESWSTRLAGGITVARRDPFVRRLLVTITLFSFLSLPFIGLIPAIAGVSLGLSTRTLSYGLLYASFGLGAAAGALAVGTVFAGVDRLRLARRSLGAFAVLLGVFALLRSAGPAYPLIMMLGAAYFTTTTGMVSALQEHLDDAVRGRVMGLWMMGFGGTVPLGLLLFGKVADALSSTGRATAATLTVVLIIGAVVALAMALVDVVGSRVPEPAPIPPGSALRRWPGPGWRRSPGSRSTG